MDPENEENLVLSLLNGDEQAHAIFIDRHLSRIRGVCLMQVGFCDAIDDLVQDTVMRGLSGLRTLRNRRQLGAWLSSIARRVCIDHVRNLVKERARLPDIAQSVIKPGDLEGNERLSRLMDEINNLPEELREVLVLKYYRDMSYEQMAESLSVSVATVNARLTHSRQILRERVSREVAHDF